MKKENVYKELTKVQNLVSLSRFIFAIFVFFLILTDHKYFALAFYTIGALTDALDGYLARKLKRTTLRGSFLDAAADRFFIVLVVIALIITRDISPLLKTVFLFWLVGEGILGFFITRKIHKFYLYAIHRNSIRATAFFAFIAVGWVIIKWPYVEFLSMIIIVLGLITIIDYTLWLISKRTKIK